MTGFASRRNFEVPDGVSSFDARQGSKTA